jgi:glyoxylase-like metal-dependent hydrolase (beta-lactamase superfamily II)
MKMGQLPILAGIVVTLALAGCEQQQQPTGMDAVADAMGATDLATIEYAGRGSLFSFGQAYLPGDPWPRFAQRDYRVSADYRTPAMRFDSTRGQGEYPPHGGGGQPVGPDQRAVQTVSGDFAWNENGNQATPVFGAGEDRRRALWATPHGAIIAALANGGAMSGNTIRFTVDGRDISVSVSGDNLVTEVSYLETNEVIGDYRVVITYSDYADYGGVQFPRHIVRTEDGFPTLDIVIDSVTPNATVAISVPDNVRDATPPGPVTARSEELAPGVWYINSAGAWSWAADFGDYAVVVEGITSEARSLAVIDEVNRLMPGKEIRYLINTHAHYDHAGGLRTYVARGTTIVTHETNVPFYREAWARPRSLAPDTLSMNPREAIFKTVSDRMEISGGGKTIALYHMANTGHNGANLLVYVPGPGLAFWGDGYNPPAGDDPVDPARTPEYGIDLYKTITLNDLDVRTVAPAHGAGARPFEALMYAIGLLP